MELKPGYQTTEFWMTILANIAGIISLFHPVSASVLSLLPQVAGILVMVASSVAYIISRGKVKAATVTAAATVSAANAAPVQK